MVFLPVAWTMFPVQLKSTLSHASPDKAAEIRSVVTGALQHGCNGMFCFERSVETTFVLPWDLNPRVQPQKLSCHVRDVVRAQLMDEVALAHLDQSQATNWSSAPLWQYRSPQGGAWNTANQFLKEQLEIGYHDAGDEFLFDDRVHQYKVDYPAQRLACVASSTIYEIRRLSFAPLMPMKVKLLRTCLFFIFLFLYSD